MDEDELFYREDQIGSNEKLKLVDYDVQSDIDNKSNYNNYNNDTPLGRYGLSLCGIFFYMHFVYV
jgi:hypothetical protein